MPLIVVSGNPDATRSVRALDDGADDFMARGAAGSAAAAVVWLA